MKWGLSPLDWVQPRHQRRGGSTAGGSTASRSLKTCRVAAAPGARAEHAVFDKDNEID